MGAETFAALLAPLPDESNYWPHADFSLDAAPRQPIMVQES